MMAEPVVYDLQIVEIDNQDCPGPWRVTIEPRQGGAEGGTISKPGELIDAGAPFSLKYPFMPLQRDGTEMDANIDDRLFVVGGITFLPAIKCEGADNPSGFAEDRLRPARSKPQRKRAIPEFCPTRIDGDVRNEHRLAEPRGAAT